MHDASEDSHERRIRMADNQEADKGEETTADGRHDHTAHVAADRARKDGDHKAVRGLLLLTDDGANLVMHARVVAGHPVGKHQTKEDHEQLRGRIGDEREHTAAKLGSNLRHILRCHGNQRRKIIVQILLERRVIERLGMRDHLVEIATRNTKLLGQAAQDFHDLTKENRRQDANDTDEHGNNNNKRDKRKVCVIYGLILANHLETLTEFTHEELIVCKALENATDYDLKNFKEIMENYLKPTSNGRRIVFPKDFADIAAFTTTCDWCVYNRIFASRTAEWGEMEEGILDMSTYYYEANPASVLLDNINAARQTWNYG